MGNGRKATEPGPLTERVRAVVDDTAIEDNCRRLRALLGPATALCAVVKADGYGHGAAHAARAAQRGGADWVAVVSAGEAVALRTAGVAGRLLVMGALTPAELRDAVAARADIVAWAGEFVAVAAAGSS
jgi:alanine racemase